MTVRFCDSAHASQTSHHDRLLVKPRSCSVHYVDAHIQCPPPSSSYPVSPLRPVRRRLAAVPTTRYFIDKMIPLMALVYGSEILVDWIKHSFVTRFNNINSNIYKTFTRILYKDIAKGYHHGDYSHSIVRRCVVLGRISISFCFGICLGACPGTAVGCDRFAAGCWRPVCSAIRCQSSKPE